MRLCASRLPLLALPALLTLLALGPALSSADAAATTPRQILVFGGNGFLGSATAARLIAAGDNVTILNRQNWYWDSSDRIRPYVNSILCDRLNPLDTCYALINYLNRIDQFDHVIDFSAFTPFVVKDAGEFLKDKVKGVYVLISTDSIYDVCEKTHEGPAREVDDARPSDIGHREELNIHHDYGNRKFQAEEMLVAQRENGGMPYVTLRLPDVFGPRDGTYRWWIYQMWVKLSTAITDNPVAIPYFLDNYNLSLVYSEDVADLIPKLLEMKPQVIDQVINVAYPETFTLRQLLKEIEANLELEDVPEIEVKQEPNTLFLYPSVRRGPIEVSKAQELLDWSPTPWRDAVRDTVQFYETVLITNGEEDNFSVQKDEIVQLLGHELYAKSPKDMYSALEKLYGMQLGHFKHDEL